MTMHAEQYSIMTKHDADGDIFRGDYAVLDFETSGLFPQDGARIIEVAVTVIERDGRVVREYDSLVHAEEVGPSQVHGITASMLAGAPTFAEIAGDLLDVLAGNCIVAHNLPFEDRFLASELDRIGVNTRELRMPSICTLQATQRYVKGLPSYKLEGLLASRNLELVDAHRARGDVRGLARILPAILDRMPVQRFSDVVVPQLNVLKTTPLTREAVTLID